MTLELVTISINPAIGRARELLKASKEDRELQEKLEKAKELFHTYLQCTECRKEGILKKYNKNTMLHIPHRTSRKGKEQIVYDHICTEHAKDYKPQSERLGHVNGV